MIEELRLRKNQAIKQTMLATKQKRKLQKCSVYKFKIQQNKLTSVQKEQLKMIFVEAKWLVNDVLSFGQNPDNKIWEYRNNTNTVNVLQKGGELVERKLTYLGSQMKQSIISEIISNIRALSTLKKKGKRVGTLKFRSSVKEINLKQYPNTYKFLSKNKIKLQNITGAIKVNGLSQFLNDPNIEFANAKILNTPKGYYVAVTTYKYKKDLKTKKEYSYPIGIDMGCQTSITISDGEKINVSIKESERLRRLSRKMNRQKKGSNNRYKTKALLRKEYENLTNEKNDIANKIVAQLLSHSVVVMQDENLKGWHSSNHGKAVQHSVLGRIKAKLAKHERVLMINRFLPTSKQCYICGEKHNDLKLSDRMFICPHCGQESDRDIHAAKNMLLFAKDSKNIVGLERIESTPVDKEALLYEIEKFHLATSLVEAGSPIL